MILYKAARCHHYCLQKYILFFNWQRIFQKITLKLHTFIYFEQFKTHKHTIFKHNKGEIEN